MDWAGTSERVHGELAWILAALTEVRTRGIRHIFINDLMNAPGHLLNTHTQTAGKTAERALRSLHIELHLATQEVTCIEITQN